MANKKNVTGDVFFIVVDGGVEGPITQSDLHDAVQDYFNEGVSVADLAIYKAHPKPSKVSFLIETE